MITLAFSWKFTLVMLKPIKNNAVQRHAAVYKQSHAAVCTQRHAAVSMQRHASVYMQRYAAAYMHIQMHMYTYTCKNTHTHTHTHMHIHVYALESSQLQHNSAWSSLVFSYKYIIYFTISVWMQEDCVQWISSIHQEKYYEHILGFKIGSPRIFFCHNSNFCQNTCSI